MPGSTQSDQFPGNPSTRSTLEESELEAALQLLVERAQYITGATGTALALPQGDEMVCRASAGSCAPTVGARLQVRSGLTGESIARRQLLRCDNAETDPRVNLEACRALGIASMVVLPLLRRNGEIRGLFELLSDHPYAFEERDLIALERMADLTLTALDLAELHHGSVPPPPSPAKQPEAKPLEKEKAPQSTTLAAASNAPSPLTGAVPSASPEPAIAESAVVAVATLPVQPLAPLSPQPVSISEGEPQQSASVPEAMLRVQKCSSCGFPVSEGRTLCIDCEAHGEERRIGDRRKPAEKNSGEPEENQGAEPVDPAPEEILPPFLSNSMLVEESWIASHVNLLAILVLIAGILVVIVVFR